MFQEYDIIELIEPLSELLVAGTCGATMMVYPGEQPEYKIEFFDRSGQTIEVRTVPAAKIKSAADGMT